LRRPARLDLHEPADAARTPRFSGPPTCPLQRTWMNALERTADWHQANQRVLAAGINAVRQVLELVAHDPADPSAIGLVDAAIVEAEASMPLPSSLNELVSRFGLTSFERDLILLCAGMELDPAVTAAWQQATGIPGAVLPTFGVALEVLPSAHWSAMT